MIISLATFIHRCIPVPDETCIALIPYTYYTPNTSGFPEELSREFMQLIREFRPFDECRAILTVMACLLRYPACNSTTRLQILLPLCPEFCRSIDSNIENCAPVSYDNYPSLSMLVNTLECTEIETYLVDIPPQYISNDSTVCTEFSKSMCVRSCVYARVCVHSCVYACVCMCVCVLLVYM